MALCGELYKETVGLWEDDPGLADDWLAYADHIYVELERDSETDEPVGPSKSDVADAIRITRAHGIPADQDSLRRLASAMYRTKLKAAATLSRRAEPLFGIYEDTYGSAEIGAGVYLIMAVVAFMMLQAAPAFLRSVFSSARLWPVIGGGVAFWWLAFQGRPWIGAAVCVAGVMLS